MTICGLYRLRYEANEFHWIKKFSVLRWCALIDSGVRPVGSLVKKKRCKRDMPWEVCNPVVVQKLMYKQRFLIGKLS
jgi:hypothetical protein